MKNNRLTQDENEEFLRKYNEAIKDGNITEATRIFEKYSHLDIANEVMLVDKLKQPDFVNGLIIALQNNPELEIYEGVVIKGVSLHRDINGNTWLSDELKYLSGDTPYIFHSDHPQYRYDGETDLSGAIKDIGKSLITGDKQAGLAKEVGGAYVVYGAEIVVKSVLENLPSTINVGKTQYDIKIDGKTLAKKVSFGGTVTAIEGTYEIYLDSQQYSGGEFVKAAAISSTVALTSIVGASKFGKIIPTKYGYMVPIVDGGFAHIIKKVGSFIKETNLAKDNE
ncbi:MAG TPA: hypothetical protein IAB06_03535 [Candidatus Avacidaminococcus intestinavium]|uniref:Uncharacterized protein n=1 Tax=Candidatus Avacidaminococcus intestinavium TaxID=2840684 RepID=A0A9D1SKS0_9FIRM|nr:hypothetical protein [Candidatus Avacidaminococcus intestinavium]